MDTSRTVVMAGAQVVAPAYAEPKAGFPLPLDMTDLLNYEQLVSQIALVNNMNGPFLMREFLRAKELVASYYTKSMFEHEQAKDRSKKLAAIAYLEKAPEYFKKLDKKPTDEGCKRYADMDDDYLGARQIESYYKALTEFLRQKMEKFQAAHDDVKKIFSGTQDPRGSSPAIPRGSDSQ